MECERARDLGVAVASQTKSDALARLGALLDMVRPPTARAAVFIRCIAVLPA
jgi:hypothetical protein